MRRLAFLFPVLAWAGAAWGQGAPDRSLGKCAAGTPEASIAPLRPIQVAVCNYGPAEFHARIDRLLATREGRLGIEEVERIFAMPPIATTIYDNPRWTDYRFLLTSAPGREQWSAVVYVEERFGPDIESRPIRFRGSGRPVRIDSRERGDIRVHLVLRSEVVLAPGQPFCLPVAELRERAVRRGWVPDSWNPPGSPHAPPGWKSITLRRGLLAVSTNFFDGHPCVENLYLEQRGDPPIQPITAAEQAELRRRNGN